MSRNTKTSSLTEAAMICGMLVLMSMVSFYVFPFIDFLFPLPAIILGKRRGYKYSALSLVSASLIIMMLLGLPMGFMYLFMYTPIAIAMSYLINKDKKPSTVILGGAVVMLISLILVLFVIDIFTGIKITEQITSMFEQSLNMQKNIMNSVGANEEQLKLLTETYSNLAESIVLLLPAMLMTLSLLMSVVNYFVAQRVASRFKIAIIPLRDLSMFYLPKNFIFGIGFLMILAYILSMMKFANMEIILINIVMIGRIALIVQGLALTKFYLIKNNVNNFLRVIVFFVIIFIPLFSNIVTMLAVIDLIIDFRKLRLRR